MTIALILASGVGARMGQDIPKQFINVYDKPVIIYTLEAFQNHPGIDAIQVVCLEGWHDILRAYSKQFGITKLEGICSGGADVHESIRNGIQAIKDNKHDDDDVVIIHDGVRPLVDTSVLSDVISKTIQYGNAVSSMPYNEQIFYKGKDPATTNEYLNRDLLQRVSTPQGYKLGKLLWAYEKAFRENIGIEGPTYVNTLMVDLGETLHFASGSEMNIKLTTKENLEMFKAYLKMGKDDWVK